MYTVAHIIQPRDIKGNHIHILDVMKHMYDKMIVELPYYCIPSNNDMTFFMSKEMYNELDYCYEHYGSSFAEFGRINTVGTFYILGVRVLMDRHFETGEIRLVYTDGREYMFKHLEWTSTSFEPIIEDSSFLKQPQYLDCKADTFSIAIRNAFGSNIEKVIFNKPATIVFWTDGTKTVVKCGDGDVWDEEKGLAMAICKKLIGLKEFYKHYNKAFEEGGEK